MDEVLQNPFPFVSHVVFVILLHILVFWKEQLSRRISVLWCLLEAWQMRLFPDVFPEAQDGCGKLHDENQTQGQMCWAQFSIVHICFQESPRTNEIPQPFTIGKKKAFFILSQRLSGEGLYLQILGYQTNCLKDTSQFHSAMSLEKMLKKKLKDFQLSNFNCCWLGWIK